MPSPTQSKTHLLILQEERFALNMSGLKMRAIGLAGEHGRRRAVDCIRAFDPVASRSSTNGTKQLVAFEEIEAWVFFVYAPVYADRGMMAQTATLLGPSKTESLSGYRLGIVVGNETLIRSIENVLSITSLRAPAYAQHVLCGWLAEDADWLEHRIGEFKVLRAARL